jgi:predicted transcriptional regulator
MTERRVMANACYEHIGAHLGSVIMERVLEQGWLQETGNGRYRITDEGVEGFRGWGIDVRPLLEDRT